MGWLDTANGVISLIVGLCGLVGTGISVFFLIRNLIKTMKNNTLQENWKLIMKIADEAMAEVEDGITSGADKKQLVIDAVKAGCKAAGINADAFLDQLDAYIDDCIKFANKVRNTSCNKQ